MGLLRLGSGGGLVLALVFNILALATPAWLASDISSCGLFQCKAGELSVKIDPKGVAEKVAIAFNILAMICLIPASALVLWAGKDEDKRTYGKLGGLAAIAAALFILIEMATYTGLLKSDVSSNADIPWGYSYGLGWTAFCLALIGGVVALVGK